MNTEHKSECPLYRAAQDKGSKPMGLCAYEVAEYKQETVNIWPALFWAAVGIIAFVGMCAMSAASGMHV